MRLDKYLKVARIIKRRPIAKDILDSGFVKINGKVAKPSTEVKEEDILELTLADRKLTVRVLAIQNQIRKGNESSLYEVVKDETISVI